MPADYSRTLDRMRELDRKMAAAGRRAKAKQVAGRREMWRKNKQKQRAKQRALARTQDAGQRNSATSFEELFGEAPSPPAKPLKTKENPIRSDLVALSRDRRAPASARVTALRTLAEMDGHIGKLQQTAGDTAGQPLATLTREQLENELARLRSIVASRDA